jgi:hypothetical protein
MIRNSTGKRMNGKGWGGGMADGGDAVAIFACVLWEAKFEFA